MAFLRNLPTSSRSVLLSNSDKGLWSLLANFPKPISPSNLFFHPISPPTHSPLSQQTICFFYIYHQENNLLGVICTLFFPSIYKQISSPMLYPSDLYKRKTYLRPALLHRLWIFLLQIWRHQVSSIHLFPVSSILT